MAKSEVGGGGGAGGTTADRDSDTSTASQSNRALAHHQQDGDSQVNSDQQTTQHQSQQQQLQQLQQQQQHGSQLHLRSKSQKHVVGAAGSRLHARVPSSRTLLKHHPAATTSSTTKLHRRQVSPTSPDPAVQLSFASSHRRAVSDAKLSSESSSTNLKKNASQSSLKRNRSHADVANRRNKSLTQLKRTNSNPGVNKAKSTKNQVHFDLGNDGQEDEWVDASGSASPYLSRRESLASSGQPSSPASKRTEDNEQGVADKISDDQKPPGPTRELEQRAGSPVSRTNSHLDSSALSASVATNRSQHNEYLTSRLLLRSPAQGAPPVMSTETASASRSHSPDSSMDHEHEHRDPTTSANLLNTPRTLPPPLSGSSGNQAMTSRFVTSSSQGSTSATAAGSFYTSSSRGASSRPGTGRQEDNEPFLVPLRPQSMGALPQATGGPNSRPTTATTDTRNEEAEESLTDDEAAGGVANHSHQAGARSRRNGGAHVLPAEYSRIQQKLNLERASSSIDRSSRQGQGPSAGPLLGGSGFGMHDPRIWKVMERTGMEYLVVRRYQNPVARSLSRLAQLPDADKGRRIPNSNGSAVGRSQPKHSSEYGPARFGLSQSFRERDERDEPDGRDMHAAAGGGGGGSLGATNGKRPIVPKRTFTTLAANGAGSSPETEDENGGANEGALSGSSLVDGEDDDGTLALLRNLWEKNMYLGTSQD